MISYPTKDLHKRISPKWFKKSHKQAALCKQAGKFVGNSCWTDLNPIFEGIQCKKCGYCERALNSKKNGSLDRHIDHFRPKSTYPLLAYHPQNYVLTCPQCNRDYKKDAFPRRSTPQTSTKRPSELKQEQPLLVHPLDLMEPSLESVLWFEGIVIQPIASQGSYEEQRAHEMITLFNLNGRDDLRRERATVLKLVYLAYQNSNDLVAQSVLSRVQSPTQPHANCARCYLALCQQNPTKAKQIAKLLSKAYP